MKMETADAHRESLLNMSLRKAFLFKMMAVLSLNMKERNKMIERPEILEFLRKGGKIKKLSNGESGLDALTGMTKKKAENFRKSSLNGMRMATGGSIAKI